MNRKIFAAFVSSAVLLTGSAYAADFTDMPSDPAAAAAIEHAVDNGLLSGYEDNTVRPDANIRRSEMAVIISQACKVVKEADLSAFTDVSQNDWFYTAMARAKEMGAFSGDGDKMRPNDNISFQECFTVLSQVFRLLPEEAKSDSGTTAAYGKNVYDVSILNKFSDGVKVADWAKVFVAGVVDNGGWNGTDGKLTPEAYITRAQFAQVMDNLISSYIDKPGTYTELPEGNIMIRCDGVELKDATAKGDVYIGDSVSANGITVDNLTSEKRFVIRGCATPVVKNGELTYGEPGIKITGTFNKIQVIRPYIYLDMSGTKYNLVYGVRNSSLMIP